MTAFCTWLMHRFLRLLSSAGCSGLHPICLKVLTHILHTAKVRSVYIFRHLISQLVRACAGTVSLAFGAISVARRISKSHHRTQA